MLNARKKSKMSHQSANRETDDSSTGFKSSSSDSLSGSKDGKDDTQMYDVHFLGIVPEINMGNSLKRDMEAQLVDRLEEAQIEGKLPISGRDDDKVKVNVSKHGIKVIEPKGQEVLQRHPLHTIAQVIQYDNGFGTNNLAVKIGQVNKTVFSCYVFQCATEDQAQMICQNVRSVFNNITSKNGR